MPGGVSGSLDFDESTVEALKILFAKDDNYVQQLVVEEVGPPEKNRRSDIQLCIGRKGIALSEV